LQTRHTAARLVAVGPLPVLSIDRSGASVQFLAGSLQLNLAHFAQAWARLESCPCCDSPGRIEILNAAGAEYLQLCAAPEHQLTEWSDFLSPLAPAGATADPIPLVGSVSLPLLPEDARAVSASPEALAPLLAALGEEGVPVRCTLMTGEARHERVFCPRDVAISGGLLTAHEPDTTCQLALPAVAGLVTECGASGWTLHAAGPGGTQLLTFSAAPDGAAASAWNAAIESAFPELT
jgi:hypothetical protein